MFGCSTRQDNVIEVYYIVKHPTITVQDQGDVQPAPPPPPTTFYGNFNFILLENSIFYFNTQQIYSFCGTGIDDTKPPRVFLTPDRLTKINISTLHQFLATSISDSIASDPHFFASISSPTDTIRNQAFKIITEYFKSKKIIRYNIRNWTEEEKYVTTAKIENKKYYPDSIDWKVGFDNNFNLNTGTTDGK
ncbi:hypothetical protein EGI22_14265 [Lacihabitans sp. LS3-19]|nr:hypothetical protein [Lacihabitans sp. LS3-19]